MDESGCKKLELERYTAGELSGEDAKAIEGHLHTCGRCSARYERLKQEKNEFLRIHPFSELRAIGAMGNSGELWYERFFRLFAAPVLRPVLIPVCIVVLVGMIIFPFTGKQGLFGPSISSEIRYKGSAEPLSYIYKRNGTVYESAPNDTFTAGDKIQLFYDSRMEQYLSLLSVSEKGGVSFYYPDEKSQWCSIRTGVGRRLAYPASIELDSSAGSELVVALFSKTPFDTVKVRKWASALTNRGMTMPEVANSLRLNPPVAESNVATLMLKKQ